MTTFIARASKALSVAGTLLIIPDLLQPIAPVAAYVWGASLISLVILILTKLIRKEWGENLVISTYLASGLFVLSSILYVMQNQNEDSKEYGMLAGNVSVLQELQQSLGIMQKSLENIEKSTASIDSKMDNVKKEVSSDPRKELANMGLNWTYDNYLDAIKNQDIRALDLYHTDGMQLRSDDFQKYLHNFFSKKTATLLIKGNAVEDDLGCPTDKWGVYHFYPNLIENKDKIAFVKSICSNSRVLGAIQSLIQKEQKNVEEVVSYNDNLEATLHECRNMLSKESIDQYYADADQFLILNTNSLSLRELVLANLNSSIMSGELMLDRDRKKTLSKAITKACTTYYPKKKVKDHHLITLKEALNVLQ